MRAWRVVTAEGGQCGRVPARCAPLRACACCRVLLWPARLRAYPQVGFCMRTAPLDVDLIIRMNACVACGENACACMYDEGARARAHGICPLLCL